MQKRNILDAVEVDAVFFSDVTLQLPIMQYHQGGAWLLWSRTVHTPNIIRTSLHHKIKESKEWKWWHGPQSPHQVFGIMCRQVDVAHIHKRSKPGSPACWNNLPVEFLQKLFASLMHTKKRKSKTVTLNIDLIHSVCSLLFLQKESKLILYFWTIPA